MGKRFKCLAIATIMMIWVFGLTACGGDKVNKIDIGGDAVAGKPLASVQVRGLMDSNIFSQDDDIKIKVGWGFRNGQSVPFFIEEGSVIVVKIEGTDFVIINESNMEYNGEYEKEFREYSDGKYICTLDNERYIPNYYETFLIKLNSNSTSGTIQISVTNLMEGTWDGDGDGQTVRLYYAANNDKTAFSTVSLEDAQKKLK